MSQPSVLLTHREVHLKCIWVHNSIQPSTAWIITPTLEKVQDMANIQSLGNTCYVQVMLHWSLASLHPTALENRDGGLFGQTCTLRDLKSLQDYSGMVKFTQADLHSLSLGAYQCCLHVPSIPCISWGEQAASLQLNVRDIHGAIQQLSSSEWCRHPAECNAIIVEITFLSVRLSHSASLPSRWTMGITFNSCYSSRRHSARLWQEKKNHLPPSPQCPFAQQGRTMWSADVFHRIRAWGFPSKSLSNRQCQPNFISQVNINSVCINFHPQQSRCCIQQASRLIHSVLGSCWLVGHLKKQ